MKSPSPVVSFPGEALAVEPIINVVAGCMPRPLTFVAEAVTIHVGTAETEKQPSPGMVAARQWPPTRNIRRAGNSPESSDIPGILFPFPG